MPEVDHESRPLGKGGPTHDSPPQGEYEEAGRRGKK